jgi:hypothetical protein
MSRFYVIVSRPMDRGKRRHQLTVRKERDYSTDALPPDLTCVVQVDHCNNRQEALSLVCEALAGHPVAVRVRHGTPRK